MWIQSITITNIYATVRLGRCNLENNGRGELMTPVCCATHPLWIRESLRRNDFQRTRETLMTKMALIE